MVRICDGNGGFWYGQINSVYVFNDIKLFVLSKLLISCADHFRSLLVRHTQDVVVCVVQDLYCHGVLDVKEKNGNLFIIEKSYLRHCC